jgi:hypothetical protein
MGRSFTRLRVSSGMGHDRADLAGREAATCWGFPSASALWRAVRPWVRQKDRLLDMILISTDTSGSFGSGVGLFENNCLDI